MKPEHSPRVSILMGIYNCADTLADAVESILGQTFRDFELILCNDGSTDGTLALARAYADANPDHIVLLDNGENRGLNHTLNRCLRAARGTYIARMDGDDRSLPDRLQAEVDFLDAHPEFAFVSAELEVFDDRGVWGRATFPPEPTPRDLFRGSPFSHSACMVRRTAFDAVGGYSEGKRLLRVEDAHLWYKLYAAGFRGANLPRVLYSYRDDPQGYRKRKLRYRFNEAYVRFLVARTFRLPLYCYPAIVKPIVLGLLPLGLYTRLHQWKMGRRKNQ